MSTIARTAVASIWLAGLLGLGFGLMACSPPHGSDPHGHDHAAEEIVRGPHGGRLLVDGEFAVELAIFDRRVATKPQLSPWN